MILTMSLLSAASFIMRIMKPGMCKYARICKHFDDRSATCHSDEEASGYCGAYDDFDNYRPIFMSKLEKKLFTR
ncbi:hypothetical protein NVIE_026570 [Nitrososphaera viennensis EN76]|uniref:Uncharacterized protein n=1 Tax=Nitrososphaera viennensis EN76 TaxID=926571 RepID=A0A060HU46_9ARCH|nr:hypothetical protein NVIE_026570 [Nitrososphaera viennensis EN76]